LSFQSHVIDLFEKLGYRHIRTVDNFISADYLDDEEGNMGIFALPPEKLY
jgi:hypothetical protein